MTIIINVIEYIKLLDLTYFSMAFNINVIKKVTKYSFSIDYYKCCNRLFII